jgi:putative CRISPR-associated protein (TIGR02619 family)
MRTLLVTVGTSLISNARRDLGKEPKREELLIYLKKTEPEKASAEANSISQLIKRKTLEEGDKLFFLHSQTGEGKLCAEVLNSYYALRGFRTELKEIPDLTYEESRFKMRGLRGLVAAMIEIIEKGRKAGMECAINATGGFKAEIAYATLVGLLLNVPVYYIHEAFKEIIEMPPTSISWDYSLIFYHEDFFDWVDTDLREKGEVERRLKTTPEEERQKISFLLTEEDEFMMLSPAGEAFFRSYKSKIERPEVDVLLSSNARKTLEGLSHTHKGKFGRLFERLGTGLRHGESETISGGLRIFPKGHRDERLFYLEKGREEGKVYVLEVSLHSDNSYHRLREEFEKGRRRAGDYKEFSPYLKFAP